MNNPETDSLNQETNSPKSRSKLKSCGLIALIALIVAAGVYGYFYYRAKDIPPFEDNELKVTKVTIPDSENSYFELIKIEDSIYYPIESDAAIKDLIEAKNWNETLAQEIVNKNIQALNHFDVADNMSKFVVPSMADPEKLELDSSPPNYGSVRQIARIQALKAQLLLRQGKNEVAFEESLKILRLGYKLSNYQPDLIQYLVGVSVYTNGWKTIDSLIANGDFSSDFLLSKKDELAKHKSTNQGFQTALKLNFLWFSKAIDQISSEMGSNIRNFKDIDSSTNQNQDENELVTPQKADQLANQPTGIMPRNFYFQPNKTKKGYADWTKSQINIECNQIPPPPAENSPSKIKLFFTENAIGEILIDMSTSALSNLISKKCDLENLAEQVIQK